MGYLYHQESRYNIPGCRSKLKEVCLYYLGGGGCGFVYFSVTIVD